MDNIDKDDSISVHLTKDRVMNFKEIKSGLLEVGGS